MALSCQVLKISTVFTNVSTTQNWFSKIFSPSALESMQMQLGYSKLRKLAYFSVEIIENNNSFLLQEKLPEEERKHKEALEELHMVVDEDSRSESSSADEGKGKTKLLLERLKALEVRNETNAACLKKNNSVLLLLLALVLSEYKSSSLSSD